MSYAVNTSPFSKIANTPTARYDFPVDGYYVENDELTPLITDGTLVRQSTVSSSAVLATKTLTYSSNVSNEDLEDALVEFATDIVEAFIDVGVSIGEDLDDMEAEIEEVERHFHNKEVWYGVGGSATSLTPYTLTSAAGAFGIWVELLTAAQTPFRTGMGYFDAHRVLINDADNINPWRIQLAWGASGDAAILDDHYTEFVVQAQVLANQTFSGPVDVLMPKIGTGQGLYARCHNAAAGDIKIFVGIHEYPE